VNMRIRSCGSSTATASRTLAHCLQHRKVSGHKGGRDWEESTYPAYATALRACSFRSAAPASPARRRHSFRGAAPASPAPETQSHGPRLQRSRARERESTGESTWSTPEWRAADREERGKEHALARLYNKHHILWLSTESNSRARPTTGTCIPKQQRVLARKRCPDGFWRQERSPADMRGSTLGPRGPAAQGSLRKAQPVRSSEIWVLALIAHPG